MFPLLGLKALFRWAVVVVTLCSGVAQEGQPTTSPDTAGTGQAVEARPSRTPPRPQVRLAPIQGFDAEAAYVRSIADRISELSEQADRATEATDRVEYLLAAANLILAHQLEPACTKRLLGIEDAHDPAARERTDSSLDRAEALLQQARNLLTEGMPAREDLPEGWLGRTSERLEVLDAFARALRAYLVPGEGAERTRAMRQAASGLSPLLEASNRAVVESATLWQACLRSEAGEGERAASVLDLALADPLPQGVPYAFFSRLLRCRLIAADDGHAVALALLMQLEERCQGWFSNDIDRDNAVRAAQFARIQVLADWHHKMPLPEQESERQWCVERATKLIDEHFSEGADTVYRLVSAAPILAHPPGTESKTPGAASNGD